MLPPTPIPSALEGTGGQGGPSPRGAAVDGLIQSWMKEKKPSHARGWGQETLRRLTEAALQGGAVYTGRAGSKPTGGAASTLLQPAEGTRALEVPPGGAPIPEKTPLCLRICALRPVLSSRLGTWELLSPRLWPPCPLKGRATSVRIWAPTPGPEVSANSCKGGVCSSPDIEPSRGVPEGLPSKPMQGRRGPLCLACRSGHHVYFLPKPCFGPIFTRDSRVSQPPHATAESPRLGDRASPCTDLQRTGPEGQGRKWIVTLPRGKIYRRSERESFLLGAGTSGLQTDLSGCSPRSRPTSARACPPPGAGPGPGERPQWLSCRWALPLSQLDPGSGETPLGQGFRAQLDAGRGA